MVNIDKATPEPFNRRRASGLARNATPEPRNSRRVRDVVSGDIEALRELLPFDPAREERPGLRRGKRGAYLAASDVDGRLDAFELDARAGVADRMISRRSGLSAEQVRQWRRRHQILGRRGKAPPEVGARFLVASLLGEQTEPIAHLVSPVSGEWRPPAYVLREPLNYGLFAKCVVTLASHLTAEEIARGIGIAERDVLNAIALSEARGTR